MDLPSTREIELETLLRERESQITSLTDELGHLRLFLNNQPALPTTDSITIPPALTALLLPHINGHHTANLGNDGNAGGSGSNTVTAALLQRAKVLQEENDELYELLKQGEVGKLKEEVRGLRRVVRRLEGALKESHNVIGSLSSELEKAYDAALSPSHSHPPPNSSSQQQSKTNGPGSGNAQRHNGNVNANRESAPSSHSPIVDARSLPPTGPRSQKKPRVTATNERERERDAPPHAASNHGAGGGGGSGNGGGRRQGEPRVRERGGRNRRRSRSRDTRGGRGGGKDMDSRRGQSPAERERDAPRNIRARSRSPSRDRDRDLRRGERDRSDRDRDSRRGRPDGDRSSRRNERGSGHVDHRSPDEDRTLAARMGL